MVSDNYRNTSQSLLSREHVREDDMPFIDLEKIAPINVAPGCKLKTPFGENLMLSRVEMEDAAEIPLHDHPHEQAGIMISGTLRLTIGDETRTIGPGEMYLIPPNVPHRAIAEGGPVVVLDVFSPIREDYVAKMREAQEQT